MINNIPQYLYEEYSQWSRQLAESYTKPELEKKFNKIGGELSKATASHLRAINKTGSMSSNSQARAQSRNNVSGLGGEQMALRHALELHEFYPERVKK